YMGVSGALSTEDTAAQYVQSLLSDYLGEAYVYRYFSKEAKNEAEQLVKDIISTYKDRINNLTWMSESTKAKAIKKLDTMKLKIGYPDKWNDDLANTKLLTVAEGGSFFDNLIAMQKAYRKLSIQNQKNGVDKTGWAMNPYTVNACYNHVDNSIQFPAAILQKPFFDVNAKYEENLGGIGYIIAHEITHAFDNNGAKFDENGNATDWWTKEDYAKFQELCQKVVDLYNGRESAPGIVCNGELTLSENIADLGSAACITEIESKQSNPDYKTLYESMTKVWRSSYPRAMKQYLQQNDLHSPDKLRGSIIFQNFEQFYDAFGITENDGMWLAPEKRVTIW
ncbi:MAG: M13 family metallopeptidase, partial [Bacillota bacterium]|nr:M13 family metallopeptidase [Bacillota bacterium]